MSRYVLWELQTDKGAEQEPGLAEPAATKNDSGPGYDLKICTIPVLRARRIVTPMMQPAAVTVVIALPIMIGPHSCNCSTHILSSIPAIQSIHP